MCSCDGRRVLRKMRRALTLLAALPTTTSLSTPAGGWQAEAARLNAQAAQLRAEAGVLQESLLEERRAREQQALEPAVAVVAPSWDYPMVHGKVVLAEKELVLRWQLRDGGTRADLEVLDAGGCEVARGSGDVRYTSSRHGAGETVSFVATSGDFAVVSTFECLAADDAQALGDEAAAHLAALRHAEFALAAAEPALRDLASFDPPRRLFPLLNPRSLASRAVSRVRTRNRRRDAERSRRLAQRTLLRAEKDAAYWQRIAAVAGGDQFVCSDGEARVLAPSGDVSVTGLAPLFDSWAPARRTTFRGSCDIVLAPGFGEPGAEEPARRSPRAGGRAGGARKSRRSAETAI